MNRSQAPDFREIDQIELIHAKAHRLDNGVPVYSINGGDQELLRIEFIFENVNWNGAKPLQSAVTNSLITEGTSRLSAAEIAEKMDYYGAFLQNDYNYDSSSITLYTLRKYLSETLELLHEILADAVFPQNELSTFVTTQKQKLAVNLEKNDVISRRKLSEALFDHTLYGHPTSTEDYDQLDREQLLEYYRAAYQPANCTIVVSGKVEDNAITTLNQFFGKDWISKSAIAVNSFTFQDKPGKLHYIEREGALQSAIRIGRLAVNRNHPDFPGYQVLNTILGGYFGSRLMANIREDKGYTYGIGSAVASFKNVGYFFIASEVGANVCQSAIDEIRKEISLLQTVAVSTDELKLVKNYMLGSMLGGLENAFSHADKFKNIHFYGLDYSYYTRYVETVKAITAEEVQALALKYLDFDQFQQVVVGKL